MEMTAKQRSKIYRKAAEELFKRPKYTEQEKANYSDPMNYRGCCSVLVSVYPRSAYKIRRMFPELKLFERNTERGYWWPDSAQSIDPRILCLLLCEQIALNPQR